MISSLPPGLLLILGALVLPFLKSNLRKPLLIILPVCSFLHSLTFTDGMYGDMTWMGYSLSMIHVDSWSRLFSMVFHLAAFLGGVYALHEKKPVSQAFGYAYAGSAIAACFAGDWLTFLVFWELTSVTSVFLIWVEKSNRSLQSGFRYLIIQVISGLMLLIGVLGHAETTGSIAMSPLELHCAYEWLILLAIGIKAVFPVFHTWLSDGYPESSVTGGVFLSAFTTKLAIYVLARTFAGTSLLIPIGVIMSLYGVIYAVLENDIRRILAYHIMSQLGYMVAGIGIGSELGLNGSAAHAFAHIIYKGLLFMGAGAVIHVTGKRSLVQLGGLYKSMPCTLLMYMIGACSIAAFPLTSGFVSKSLVLSGAAEAHLFWAWILLSLASAGTFLSLGLKIPYFAFFGPNKGIPGKEPPRNMIWAMGIASFICIGIGIFPKLFYQCLPFPTDYLPYTGMHVVGQMQLLMYTALAFFLLIKWRIYPKKKPSINIDTDWFYRQFPKIVGRPVYGLIKAYMDSRKEKIQHVYHDRLSQSKVPKSWSLSQSVLLIVFLLFAFLMLDLLYKA